MRNTVLLIVLLLCICCKKSKSYQDIDWVVLNDKSKIPVQIKDFFIAAEGNEMKIANPDEKFNITDAVLDHNLPFRQLRLLERKNEVWRLVYFQGGIASSYQFYEFRIEGDTISKIRKGYSFKNIGSNDSLEYYIKKGDVKFDTLKISYKYDE